MDQTLQQIASRTVGPWLDTRDGEIRAARASGQRSASTDMALLRRRLDDFQEGLLGRAKSSMFALQQELATHENDLGRQVDDLNRALNDEINQQMSELRAEQQRVLQALDKTIGPSAAKFDKARRDAEAAERDLRTLRAQLGGRPLRRSLVYAYLPVMILLALVEVPVNRLAFELFFQEQPIISVALAAVMGGMLIAFAHFIGTWLRHTEQEQPDTAKQIKRILGIAALAVVSITAMVLLAKMRQSYINLLESEQNNSLAAITQQLQQGGTASAIAKVASQDLGTAGWTLLVFNLAIFLFGVTAAFRRHDPHPDYETSWRQNDRAQRTLTALRQRYEREVQAKTTEYGTRLAALDQLMRETQVKVDDLLRQQAGLKPFYEQTSRRVANSVRNRSLAFQEGAIAGIPKGPLQGSLDAIRSLTEDAIQQRINEEPSPAS